MRFVGLGLGLARCIAIESYGPTDHAAVYYDAQTPEGAALYAGSNRADVFAEARQRTHFELLWVPVEA